MISESGRAADTEGGITPGEAAVVPHGGVLVDLLIDDAAATELAKRSVEWPSWQLTTRQRYDLELLACGGFSPLRGFHGEDDYRSVCEAMRLADGSLWPIPVTLDVSERTLTLAESAGTLALRDADGAMLAALHLTEAWHPDVYEEAAAVFGTVDPAHPGVDYLIRHTNPWYVSGSLEVLKLPEHPDFRRLRRTPAQLRSEFACRGWHRVVAFQTRNPMHRAHQELTLRAAAEARASILIHPVVGMTKAGDIDSYTRVRCYEAILPSYPPGTAMLSLLPLAMRMAGPREALWHAIIRKNYGASHFVVGRDHAGPGVDSGGRRFYRPYEAQDLLRSHGAEIGVNVLAFSHMVYVEDSETYMPEEDAPEGARVGHISGTQVRRRLAEGAELPSWFTSPAVADELRRSYPLRSEQGVTILLTGRPGSGKRAVTANLVAQLLERGGRRVTLLDGDVIGQHLSSQGVPAAEERPIDLKRAGFVAAEITKHRGAAVCTFVAPLDAPRREMRQMVARHGGFVLVHLTGPAELADGSDPVRPAIDHHRGAPAPPTAFPGPYEVPSDAELVIDTAAVSADAAGREIVGYLEQSGYLTSVDTGSEG